MEITIRQSKRAKKLSLLVHHDGRAEVVVPARRPPSDQYIQRFIEDHREWIEKQRHRQLNRAPKKALEHPGMPEVIVRQQTENLIEHYIAEFSRNYPFEIREFVLRNYKSQWGSCSSRKRLGFHYKLSLLPESLAAYIVAHELAHTVHMNHGSDFWNLVTRVCPDQKTCRKDLRQYLL